MDLDRLKKDELKDLVKTLMHENKLIKEKVSKVELDESDLPLTAVSVRRVDKKTFATVRLKYDHKSGFGKIVEEIHDIRPAVADMKAREILTIDIIEQTRNIPEEV